MLKKFLVLVGSITVIIIGALIIKYVDVGIGLVVVLIGTLPLF